MDEHRVGLQPILRRVWAQQGQQPIVPVEPRYEWLYVYAFVQPQSGESFWLVCPKVHIAWFQVALTEFAQHTGAGETKQSILLLDQAGWHTSARVSVPLGIERLYLPSHSPELQPAERLHGGAYAILGISPPGGGRQQARTNRPVAAAARGRSGS